MCGGKVGGSEGQENEDQPQPFGQSYSAQIFVCKGSRDRKGLWLPTFGKKAPGAKEKQKERQKGEGLEERERVSL